MKSKIFKKSREIKRLNLTYAGDGLYKSVSNGGHTQMNLRGDVISKCRQTMTRYWRWDWLLREFDLVSYDINEINTHNN